MLEIMSDLPEHVVGFSAKGKVTGEDYEKILIPAIESKLKNSKKISLIYNLGSDFSGFNIEAMWDDTKTGLMHITSWNKIAIVSDVQWLRVSAKIFGVAMPGHVKVFSNSQLAEAREWVAS